MAGQLLRPLRLPRFVNTRLTVSMVLLSILVVAAAAQAADEALPRHWGFGWDPGDSGEGLTLRWRPRPDWDLSVAAGPNDFRNEDQYLQWDTDDDVVQDGTPRDADNRQEQGWVRLALGRRVWQDGRLKLFSAGSVTYRWSAEEYRAREARVNDGPYWDWYNTREHTDRDSWWFTLGVRPSYAVTPRFHVEWEAGLRLRLESADSYRLTWWDAHPGEERYEKSSHDRAFQSFGVFDLYRLRFIFWF